MKHRVKTILGLSASLLLVAGCGSDNKANSNDTIPGRDSKAGLSIVYESTTSDSGTGKMIGHYHVHAVDENGKPISGLPLKVSIVNGVKELRGQKVQHDTGTILDTAPISFHDDGINFSQTNVRAGDTLITIPDSDNLDRNYLGDWTITKVNEDLLLRERSYGLENTTGLTYIIGNEIRTLGGRIPAVAHVQMRDGRDANSTSTNDKGFTYFDVVFDPVLAGHTATIGVHTDGNRMGTAKVITFRGGKFVAPEVIVPITGGTVYAYMRLMIDPGNGGTEDLIDVDVVPTSFKVEPLENCRINYQLSDFHTNRGGHVKVAVDTFIPADSNGTKAEACTIKWEGGAGSIYYEY